MLQTVKTIEKPRQLDMSYQCPDCGCYMPYPGNVNARKTVRCPACRVVNKTNRQRTRREIEKQYKVVHVSQKILDTLMSRLQRKISQRASTKKKVDKKKRRA
jgi:predicted RNA-binding Zn-ribbon protein involved in translation (DUF1610 family)